MTDIVRKHRQFSPLRAVRSVENTGLLDPDEALREAEAILLKAKGERREEESDEQTKG